MHFLIIPSDMCSGAGWFTAPEPFFTGGLNAEQVGHAVCLLLFLCPSLCKAGCGLHAVECFVQKFPICWVKVHLPSPLPAPAIRRAHPSCKLAYLELWVGLARVVLSLPVLPLDLYPCPASAYVRVGRPHH